MEYTIFLLLRRLSTLGLIRSNGGEVAEWSIASVLKTEEPKGFGGSNPSLSALLP